MNQLNAIDWQTFKNALLQNPNLQLQFQYAENKWVDASYHITEIKQAPITSVDCGGVVNRWTEIIMQLWEPQQGQPQAQAMPVNKALSIITLVEKALPLNGSAVVKIEFGNTAFDTRQLLINQVVIDGENLLVDLRPDAVQCKAIGRGESCGITPNGEECCTPAAEKPKVKLINLAVSAETCAPGSGCC